MDYTKKQINQFKSYEIIRTSGVYNMFSPQARLASGLTKEEYLFVMKNYSELKEASEARAAEEMLLKATDKS
ncbi:hypothetical protein EBZ39_00865 [bacterium]|nr:hypothetical protein [bacterium]